MKTRSTPQNAVVKGGCLEQFLFGLFGEVGEVADIIKKSRFHGRKLDHEHLLEELGDVLWYVTAISLKVGLPPPKHRYFDVPEGEVLLYIAAMLNVGAMLTFTRADDAIHQLVSELVDYYDHLLAALCVMPEDVVDSMDRKVGAAYPQK